MNHILASKEKDRASDFILVLNMSLLLPNQKCIFALFKRSYILQLEYCTYASLIIVQYVLYKAKRHCTVCICSFTIDYLSPPLSPEIMTLFPLYLLRLPTVNVLVKLID